MTLDEMHKNHRERMYMRLKEQGASSFFDHELLEMLLYFSVPRVDTNPAAHRLLNEFKNINGVVNADMLDLKGVNGVGEKTAMLIGIVGEIIKRSNAAAAISSNFKIINTIDAVNYCKALFTGKKYERFHAICLDIKGAVISSGFICEGVINEVPAYTRKVVETALRHGAHRVILSHNHPGGDPFPSSDDDIVTEQCKAALEAIKITLNDHIIIGYGSYYSYAQMGRLGSEGRYELLNAAQNNKIIKERNR